MIKYRNLRAKSIKCLKENSKSSGPWVWQWFLRYDIKSISDEKIDRLDFLKIKAFMPQSTASRKCKDNPWSGRKYLQSIHLDKGLISQMYKELLQTQ